MIDFSLKKSGENSPHYNITFNKEVHKRTGEIAIEAGDTLYNVSLNNIKNIVTHETTIKDFGNSDISLSEYLKSFNKNYIQVCGLLKKIL